MKIGWVTLTIILGAFAAVALLRVIEEAVTGTLTSQAGVQLLIAVVSGWLAFKAFSKIRGRSN
jgi:hypothetical protein